MRIGKKVTGIVLSAFTLVLALLFAIFMIFAVTDMADTINFIANLPSYVSGGEFEKLIVIDVFRMIIALALAVLCGVTGGINLGKAIKGRPEAVLNRVALFVAFDFVGIGAVVAYLSTHADVLDSKYISSMIAYTITMLFLIIAITVVSTMARRRAMNEGGNRIAAGIMLAVVATVMITMMIIEGAAAPEIASTRMTAYSQGNMDNFRNLYNAFEIIASVIGICGTFAFAALNIVEGALAKKRANRAPAKAEEKKEEK